MDGRDLSTFLAKIYAFVDLWAESNELFRHSLNTKLEYPMVAIGGPVSYVDSARNQDGSRMTT